MFEDVKPKAQVGDKVKIVGSDILQSLYDSKTNMHTLSALTYLSQLNMLGEVKSVDKVSEDLFEYSVAFGILIVKVYDSDFYVVRVPQGELYQDIKVYLCVDSQGGMCDRLCFGDEALIKNANTSIDSWNDGQNEEHYIHVKDIDNALSVLNTDNFDVVKLEPNTVHVVEDYIVTDCDITTYGSCDPLIHSPKQIWKLISNGIYTPKDLIVDLTISTNDDTI